MRRAAALLNCCKPSAARAAVTIAARFSPPWRRRALTAFAHLAVSLAMNAPNSDGVTTIGDEPSSAMRALIFVSASAALISRLSVSTTSPGVPLGTTKPNQALAS